MTVHQLRRPPGLGMPGDLYRAGRLPHVSNEPGQELVEPNLKPYRAQELTFGLDHELTNTMSLGVRYA